MYNINCIPFPKPFKNGDLIDNKTCHVIDNYYGGKLLSILTLRENDGTIIKFLDENGIHISPENAGPIAKDLLSALNLQKYARMDKTQLFFSIVENEPILVDVYDGKQFASPGMIQSIYGKRIKTQTIKSTEKFDKNKDYGNSIIKPTIVVYDNDDPIYVRK